MVSERKRIQVWFDMFQDLYIHSEPPLDFIEFYFEIEETGDCPKDWFMKHEIDKDTYEEIVNFHFKGLSKREKNGFRFELLNYSPTFKVEE